MNECIISMKAVGRKIKASVADFNLAERKLSISCNRDDGMKLISARDHGQLIEQGYIDKPYNKEDYNINIYVRLNDTSYKIYYAKITSIFIQNICELAFSFKLYNKICTITDAVKSLGGGAI